MLPRRSSLLLSTCLVLGLAACGSGGGSTRVAAGSGAGEPTTSIAAQPDAPTTAPASDGTLSSTTAATASTTTTVAADPLAGPSDASPVAGLSAADLKAAVEAPPRGAARSVAGPTVDQVVLPDGTRVWRVRIPGQFPARGARATISVGGRVVGEGVLAPDLGSLTAVTKDGAGLTAGRPVSYQWEGGSLVAAGTLAVIR